MGAVNGFSEADFRYTPASVLQTDLTNINNAIAMRLAGTGPEVAESYVINGKTVQRTPLQFLIEYRNAIYRVLQIQAVEPDGIGLGLASLGDASGPALPNNSKGGF